MDRIVLVVDDDKVWVDHHVRVLEGSGLTIMTALTLEQAGEIYAAHRQELVAIILDGCVPGSRLNTRPFIGEVTDDRLDGDFTGILMAASSMSDFRQYMVNAGCTHESPKEDAAQRLMELLASQ